MEFLETHNLIGLLIGISTFLIIGFFHPIVIKSEYYLGTSCWWIFLFFGVIGIIAALIVHQILWSSLLGVFAFSSLWSILEIFEQKDRVEKGWFPMNPKREHEYEKKEVDNRYMEDVLQRLNSICPNTLMESLGIEFIEVGEGYLKAKMPIDSRTCRPDRALHGGANMALAETVGGALSYVAMSEELNYQVYGVEINGNHMKQAKGSYVIACGKFIHYGKRTHVIEVEIKDETGTIITVNRVTNMIL